MSITLETKVWEGDWELVLSTNRLKNIQERCMHTFTYRTIFINNVSNIDKVKKAADKLVDKNIIDNYYVVQDFCNEALEHFHLTEKDFGKGYYYSIAELVSIYLCKTKYLLHFSSDVIPEKNLPTTWVNDLLNTLKINPKVKVANLTWDRKYKEAEKESISKDGNFFYGYGFSDQMYLIRTDDFITPIYSEKNDASARYPAYGGELFEKRVDAWMRNHKHLRATYSQGSYSHKNFTKNTLIKKIQILIN